MEKFDELKEELLCAGCPSGMIWRCDEQDRLHIWLRNGVEVIIRDEPADPEFMADAIISLALRSPK